MKEKVPNMVIARIACMIIAYVWLSCSMSYDAESMIFFKAYIVVGSASSEEVKYLISTSTGAYERPFVPGAENGTSKRRGDEHVNEERVCDSTSSDA